MPSRGWYAPGLARLLLGLGITVAYPVLNASPVPGHGPPGTICTCATGSAGSPDPVGPVTAATGLFCLGLAHALRRLAPSRTPSGGDGALPRSKPPPPPPA